MTRLWLQPVFMLVKFYSAIENVDGISTRESEFYPQGVDIPTIDRASQAVIRKCADSAHSEPGGIFTAAKKLVFLQF